jgi:hypothetical protein
LAVGQRLGYEELAIYMYWVGNLSQETKSGLPANRLDGHEVVLNKAISCLAAASENPAENASFDSIGQLKCYANSAFRSAAMDVGRRQHMTLPCGKGKQALTRDEKKQFRVKRIIDNPATGPHCVDVFMDSRSGFDRLEHQELQAKLKQLVTDVLSQCKQAKYVQDTWRPNPQLTIMAGMRFDLPVVDEAPPIAPGFATAGFVDSKGIPITRNNTTNDGNPTYAPRLGFTYEVESKRKTQVRGGVGLFQGKNPAVWLSNAFSNAGAVYNYTAAVAERPLITFNPNAATQSVPGSANPPPNVNITDANFRQPALWKSNIAIDHQLPWGDTTLTVEYYYHDVDVGLNTEFLNYRQANDGDGSGLAPDGRLRFGSAASIVNSTSANVAGRRRVSTFADVLYLTNTDKGEASGVTISLSRPMKNNWAWSASWTNGNATEVSPMTSSVALSNYSNRAVFNPNENTDSVSNTNIKDTVVLSITRRFEFVKNAPTTVNLSYIGRTGRPYSWVFYGDANGDGLTFNDLLYVPTGPDDSRVAWADTAQRDAFFRFVETSSLKDFKGSNPARNSETSPWLQTVDLKLTQQIPLFKSVRAEVFANILNFANLFDSDWGIQEEVPFSYRRAVAGATLNPTANNGKGQWNYVFNSTTLNGVPVTVDETPVSRWQAQIGMRIKF